MLLADPEHYEMPDEDDSELDSLCASSSRMQYVNSYDGTLGQPDSFVSDHKWAVGAIETTASDTSNKTCTGTLIAPDLFLTAGHCAGTTITSRFVAFNYERDPGGTVMQQYHYPIIEVVERTLGDLDYAILRLDGAPGNDWGWAWIDPYDPPASEAITIIQHPARQAKRVHIGPAVGLRGNYMTYRVDTLGGSSGSGVIDFSGGVAGVHTNGGCSASGGSNSGVRMTLIADVSPTIQAILASP